MRTRVADAIRVGVEMRHVVFVVQIAEAELKHFHAREAQAVAQVLYLRRDDAKILGEDWKIAAERFFDGMEEILARTFDPFAIDGSFFSSRNGPVCLKAAEMVDPQVIGQSQLTADTVDPPFVTGCFVVIPVIERVAPQLSGSTEIIWRYSGYAGRVALRIELEQLLVRPDIGAVECDEDRDITDDLNAFSCA